MMNNRELTEDGLEKNFATNTLGTYILTTALLPLLEKEADARVITVSSGGMLVQKLNVSDLQSKNGTFDGTMVYAQNKVQSMVLKAKPRTCLLGSSYHLLCKKPVVCRCFPIASNPYRDTQAIIFRSTLACPCECIHIAWRARFSFDIIEASRGKTFFS
ncbi:dehydrogenase/reductase SDR family member 12 isoform X4 [Pithys albifrons albifrons]